MRAGSDSICRNSRPTVNKVKEHLVEIANCMNPLDFTFNLNSSVYYNKIPKLLATSGKVDCCLTYGSFGPAYFNYSSVGEDFDAKS